ncbi:MAG: glycoside hydrolase family 31 protein [Prevotellaceae bacterium]|nr:glycoside hydrolase family 31 protein [Prevotellaceae bacterium]
MRINKRVISALMLLSTLGLSAASFTQNGNFITIEVQNPGATAPRWVRLQVVGKKIIRVEATREASFPVKESLIIVPQQQPDFKYSVQEDNSDVSVNTTAVIARVNKQTGRVRFYDENGKQIVAEDENGKQLWPYTVPEREIGVDSHLSEAQKHGWTWRLLFDNGSDEAFYGLGQHQANELNMKGKNEELYQYNTKVSVPFVLSNRGYGILWDSYSYCRFGNPNANQPINRVFKLYDKDGNPGALTGTYADKDGKQLVRREDSINYEVSLPAIPLRKNSDGDVSHLPQGFKLKGAHVTYEGYIEAPEDNNYHFNFYYAGYTKMFVDGKEVMPEHWRQAWNPNACKFDVAMKKGQKSKVLIDWYPDGDVSYCGLRVATPESESEQQKMSIWSEMAKDLDYYFIAGKDADEIIHGYRTLTGKAQVFPKWALGFWQSRERYKTSGEIEETLGEFRKRHIPVDNIVQDWNYWAEDQWGSHQFEQSRYPHPQAMLDSVHAMHGRFMISVWPKFYPNTKNYQELDAHGWMYHQSIADSIRDWVGPGYMNSFYDAYSAGARKLFWHQMDENLYSKYKFGIDAWWMDASEPNVRDCTPMWYRKALSGPTALGSSTEYFNAYSIVNADAIYNGQRSVNPNQRVFLLTRSGFAGEQRYSTATWSGDIGTRWEDMRAQMTAGMNYCIAGLPFWGMDQGGFSVEDRYVKAQQEYDRTGVENADLKEWRELQARWNEFGCFIPLYRTHGQWPLREVWNIAPENHPAYKAIVWYDNLRYHLMPYLYSLDGAVHFKDYTMMRALVMDFNGDDKVYDIKDQWMFGPALMACPVAKYQARSRQVYLPKQKGWYDFYTGKHYAGGQTITADAPLEKIPVFVPEGAILPLGPQMQWSDEKPAELINLYVYAGRDGQFTLYEDEGTNYNYEKGKYATIDFQWNDRTRQLTIGDRKGSFDGMLQKRRFNIVVVSADASKALDLNTPAGKLVKYSGKKLTVKM